MKTKRATILFVTTAFIAFGALAQTPAPSLPLSKAAKLAEDAIASASLPADCYLRSITLIPPSDSPAYYRASYKPTVTNRIRVGDAPPPHTIDIIRITMDGKVTFEQEQRAAGAAPTIRVK